MGAMLIASIGGSALASDLPVKAYPHAKAPSVEAPLSWTGFYAGGQVGGADGTWNNSPLSAGIGPFTTGVPLGKAGNSGIAGGLHAGYNYQMANIVVGIEADYNWTGVSTYNTHLVTTGPGLAFDVMRKLNNYGTIRGRLGVVAQESMLLYATGGWAYGSSKSNVAGVGNLGGPFSDNGSSSHTGWTAGVGADYMVTQHWIAGIEYKHVDLGSKAYSYNFPLATVTGSSNLKLDELTARVSYKF